MSSQGSQVSGLSSQLMSTKSHNYSTEDPVLSKLADECVQYILLCCLAEHKSIVKRIDLNKNILKDHSRQYKTVIKMVNDRLNDVFGLELVEIDETDKGERFGIRNKYKYDSSLHQVPCSDDKSSSNEDSQEFQNQFKYSMIMICLALIFMNENEMDASLMWDNLKRLDINKDEKKHKYLGDVSKFFTSELVKDGYLEYEQVKGIDPPKFKFKSGFRSKLEIKKSAILEFVCQMYGGSDVCKPNEWSIQYADALKEEEENERKKQILSADNENAAVVSKKKSNAKQNGLEDVGEEEEDEEEEEIEENRREKSKRNRSQNSSSQLPRTQSRR